MSQITVDIQAKVVGYQASLKQMQQEIAKLDPGSEIGKKLGKAFEQASAQLKGLEKNMSPKASSMGQIEAIADKVNKLGDTIQGLASKMQEITVADFKAGSFGTEVNKLAGDIQNLKTQLDSGVTDGIRNIIDQSQQLKDAFSNLKIDYKNQDYTTMLDGMAKGVEDAAKRVTDAQKELNKATKSHERSQAGLDALKANPLSDKNKIESDLKGITDQYTKGLETLKEQVSKNVEDLFKKNNITTDPKNIISNFLGGLTPQNLTEHVQTLKNDIQNAFKASGSAINAKDIYGQIFGQDMVTGLGRSTEVGKNLINTLFPNFEQTKTELKNKFAELSTTLKPTEKQSEQIGALINEGNLEAAVSKTMQLVEKAYKRVQEKIVQETQVVAQKLAQVKSADTKAKAEEVLYNNLVQAQTKIAGKVNDLQAGQDQDRARITALEQTAGIAKQQEVEKTRSNAASIAQSAQQFRMSGAEASNYGNVLDKVISKEQLVGKIQGVVQRWFSIYAAVRMVGNAIREVTNIISELDKTITEISIVTDMSQSDLWGQMGSYTSMAQKYAASISGVYKVSQLYYQQGLQTNDVMALTEQTLKMARISGLEYSTATDYMTNAVRSFKMEMTDAQTVVDTYAAVAASSATSVSELANAMSKTASSAQAVGSSFQNTTAMMAVMIEATRESAENIGSALKSIISRYGEMKADPSKLIDSEGEEMDFNKVEAALKSVGISLKDTTGQFRNFDDVIVELAQSWDTIDKNTQRYIATIMAGNRQQSRFLALVSSGERLEELMDTANNSEDASQLQFLKTLDSIDAKKQQIQTSLQSLYTDVGLEKLFKSLLDYANKIVTTFNQLGEKGGLGTALAKFGSSFTNTALFVTTLFASIKNGWFSTQSSMTQTQSIESLKRQLIDQQEAVNSTLRDQEAAKAAGAAQEQQTEKLQQEIAKRDELQNQYNQALIARQRKMSKWGMVASAAGGALSTWAATMKTDTQEQRTGKAITTGLGSALTGLGTGLMVGASAGGPAGAIIGVLSALPGIIEAIGIVSESTAEKIDRLQNNLTEASNARIKSQDELKTLQDYKKKYEELYKARNDSNEAYQKYLDLSNEIASKYPTLISGMDEEGNYIVELTANYEALLKAKQAAYNNDFIKEGAAEIKAYSNKDFLINSLGIPTGEEKKWFQNFLPLGLQNGSGEAIIKDFSDYLKNLTADEIRNLTYEELFSNGHIQWKNATDLTQWEKIIGLNYYQLEDLLINKPPEINTPAGQILSRGQLDTYHFINATGPGVGIAGASTRASALENILIEIGKLLDQNKTLGEIEQELSKTFGIQFSLNTDLFSSLNGITASAELRDSYLDKLIKSKNLTATNNAISQLGLNTDLIQTNFIADKVQKSWETYKSQLSEDADLDQAWKLFMLQVSDIVSETFSNFNWYKNLSNQQQSYVNEIYKNAGQYTSTDIKTLLEGYDQNLILFIKKHQEEVASFGAEQYYVGMNELIGQAEDNPHLINSLANVQKFVTKIKKDNGEIEYSNLFGTDQLQTIYKLYKDIFKNDNLTNRQKYSQMDELTSILTTIKEQTPGLRNELFNIVISSGDLTSLTGIYDIIDNLDDSGIDPDIINPIKEALIKFSKNLNVNLSSELATYVKSYSENLKSVTSVLDKAVKGMSQEEALALANRLKISLKQFEFKDGKYYYKDIQQIIDSYVNTGEELERLESEMTNLFQNKTEVIDENTVKHYRGLLKRRFRVGDKNVDTLELIDQNYERLLEFYNEEDQTNFYNWFKNIGIGNEQDADKVFQIYEKYIDSYKSDNQGMSLTEYIEAQMKSQLENLEQLSEEERYLIGSYLIQTGQITKFVKAFMPSLQGDTKDQTIKALESGEYSSLMQEGLSQFISVFTSGFKNIAKEKINAMINILKTNTQQTVSFGSNDDKEAVKAASDFAKQLEELGYTASADGAQVLITSYQGLKDELGQFDLSESYNVIKQAIMDSNNNPQEKEAALKELYEQFYGSSSKFSAWSAITSSYTSFGREAANAIAQAMKGKNVDKLDAKELQELGIEFDSKTGEYSTSVENLYKQLQSNKLGLESYNKAIAALDKSSREHSIADVLSTLIKNRKSLTEDNISQIATNLQVTYEAVKGWLTSNGDGTYSVSLDQIRSVVKAANIELSGSLLELLAQEVDTIVAELTGLSTTQSQGYTKMADMQKFMNSIKDNLPYEEAQNANFDSLFSWDETLNAYKLTAEGIGLQFMSIFTQLGEMSEQEQQLFNNTIQATKEKFAQAIKPTDLLKEMTLSEQKATFNAFDQAVEDYNDFLDAIGDTGERLSALDLKHAITGGGLGAIKAAQFWADISGQTLSGDDIESLYRGRMTSLSKAVDQINLSVGSIISATTAELLNFSNTLSIGDGKYVIDSAINLVEAYKSIYDAMYYSGTATLQELNNLKATQFAEEGNTKTVDALSSASSMTYDALAQIFTNAGLVFDEVARDFLISEGTIKDLGGGKIRIENFQRFAELMKWDAGDLNSEEYVSALKSYNDALIELNNKVEKDIASEIQSIADAKPGDKVNLTQLYASLGQSAIDELNSSIMKWGGYISNGILDLNDSANIYQIIQKITTAADNAGVMLSSGVSELADKLSEIMKNFADILSTGISGKLTHSQADTLKTQAKSMFNVDIDFTQTADGLRVSQEAAIQLYTYLQQIDSIAAGIVFDGLKDSLEQASEDCESITRTMASIKTLSDQLSSSPDNTALKERLDLYTQIAAAQMQEAEQYNFMNNALPDYLQGPKNYWDSWGKAFTAMNEAVANYKQAQEKVAQATAQGGSEGAASLGTDVTAAASGIYMEIQDFYNIVNEMNNMAQLSGTNLEFMGMTLDGSMEAASALIEKGLLTLTNIDGKGAKINLAQFGIDIEGGASSMATGIDDGIKAVAESQIQMIDGMIGLLETVVQMEELGKMDLSSDGGITLDIGKMFDIRTEGTGENAQKIYTITSNIQGWAAEMLKLAKTNKDIENALTMEFNGVQLGEMMQTLAQGGDLAEDAAQEYFSAIQVLYQMYRSGEYDLDNLIGSIQAVAQKAGFVGEIKIGDVKVAIGYGVSLTSNKDGEYEVNGQKYPDAESALQAYIISQLGKNITGMGEITYDDGSKGTKAIWNVNGQQIQVEVGNGEASYIYKGTSYATPKQALKAAYDDYVKNWQDMESRGIHLEDKLSFEEYAARAEVPVAIYADSVTLTNPKEFQQRTHEEVVRLVNALAGDDQEEIIAAAKEVGIEVDVNGQITEAQLQEIAKLAGIESKTAVYTVAANFNGPGGEQLSRLLSGEPIPITVTAQNEDLTIEALGVNIGELTAIANFSEPNMEQINSFVATLVGSSVDPVSQVVSNVESLYLSTEGMTKDTTDLDSIVSSMTNNKVGTVPKAYIEIGYLYYKILNKEQLGQQTSSASIISDLLGFLGGNQGVKYGEIPEAYIQINKLRYDIKEIDEKQIDDAKNKYKEGEPIHKIPTLNVEIGKVNATYNSGEGQNGVEITNKQDIIDAVENTDVGEATVTVTITQIASAVNLAQDSGFISAADKTAIMEAFNANATIQDGVAVVNINKILTTTQGLQVSISTASIIAILLALQSQVINDGKAFVTISQVVAKLQSGWKLIQPELPSLLDLGVTDGIAHINRIWVDTSDAVYSTATGGNRIPDEETPKPPNTKPENSGAPQSDPSSTEYSFQDAIQPLWDAFQVMMGNPFGLVDFLDSRAFKDFYDKYDPQQFLDTYGWAADSLFDGKVNGQTMQNGTRMLLNLLTGKDPYEGLDSYAEKPEEGKEDEQHGDSYKGGRVHGGGGGSKESDDTARPGDYRSYAMSAVVYDGDEEESPGAIYLEEPVDLYFGGGSNEDGHISTSYSDDLAKTFINYVEAEMSAQQQGAGQEEENAAQEAFNAMKALIDTQPNDLFGQLEAWMASNSIEKDNYAGIYEEFGTGWLEEFNAWLSYNGKQTIQNFNEGVEESAGDIQQAGEDTADTLEGAGEAVKEATQNAVDYANSFAIEPEPPSREETQPVIDNSQPTSTQQVDQTTATPVEVVEATSDAANAAEKAAKAAEQTAKEAKPKNPNMLESGPDATHHRHVGLTPGQGQSGDETTPKGETPKPESGTGGNNKPESSEGEGLGQAVEGAVHEMTIVAKQIGENADDQQAPPPSSSQPPEQAPTVDMSAADKLGEVTAAADEAAGSLAGTGEAALAAAGEFDKASAAFSATGGASSAAKARIDAFNSSLGSMPNASSKLNAVADSMSRVSGQEFKVTLQLEATSSEGSSVKGTITSSNPMKIINVGSAAAGGKKRTLMGELGPELVVSNGRYFVVGQGGAEFVDLDDDAIVFNHLQTKRLLSTGIASRGKPITSEKAAISFATGNTTGPAHASASAALAALRQIRAMWESMLGASLHDLGQQAGQYAGGGAGGGGGGGGGDKSKPAAAYIADLDRWYTLLRQISNIEKEITYQENLRSKLSSDLVTNGELYYESQKKTLKALDDQIAKSQDLAQLQRMFYDERVDELNENWIGQNIFKFDKNGVMTYTDIGLALMAELNAQGPDNKPKYDTARKQFDFLVKHGYYKQNQDIYDSSGKLIEWTDDKGKEREEAYSEAVQAFWDAVDAQKEELDSLYDSLNDTLNDVLAQEQARNEILKEMQENQLNLEQKVVKAIENREQKVIDALQDEKDALEKMSSDYIDGLNKSLEKERSAYDRQQEDQELNKLRRQLAILQRSGGSASQIHSLQTQIQQKEQDAYFNAQQEQIDAIQEASDKELERLDHQIEIMTESLEYQKEHGLLWAEVSQIMAQQPEEIYEFLTIWDPDFSGLSALGQESTMQEIKSMIYQWTARRDDENEPVEEDRAGEGALGWKRFGEQVKDQYASVFEDKDKWAEVEKAYLEEYAKSADPNKAAAAARAVLEKYGHTTDQTHPAFEHIITQTEDEETYGGRIPSTPWGQERVRTGQYSSRIKNDSNKLPLNNSRDTNKEILDDLTNSNAFKEWKDKIVNEELVTIRGSIAELQALYEEAADVHMDERNYGDNVVIEHAEVNMNTTISDDYDARQAGQNALEEMIRIARKKSVTSLGR